MYISLFKFKMLPSQYYTLDDGDRAFIDAAIAVRTKEKAETAKKMAKKNKNKNKNKKGR